MIPVGLPSAAPAPRVGLLAGLGLTAAVSGKAQAHRPDRFTREGVSDSEDLQRILTLPRRPPPTQEQQEQMAAVMTALLRRERTTPCRCQEIRPGVPCITRFFGVQGWYLWEAMQQGGALGMLAAGSGKTALDIFAVMVVKGARRAALLIPPKLRGQFARDFALWSQHFRVPNLAEGDQHTEGAPKLDVLAYTELSHPSCAEWLRIHQPDLLICDEGHKLGDVNAVGTNRFLRHFVDFEATRLLVHSGSLTTDSPDDYGHLAAISLREGSPLPLVTSVVTEWADAIGPNPVLQPGALQQLCRPGEGVRLGFQRRLIETPGVVTTADAQVPNRLIIQRRPFAPSAALEAALRTVRGGTRPDTEELQEQVEIVACARQVALGFFYRWCYPRGEDAQLIDEWFTRRKAWNRALRLKLEHRTNLLDSPALCRDAAERHAAHYSGHLPTWYVDAWVPWREIEQLVQPEPETQWLDESVALDAVQWACEAPGIVWYQNVAFGLKVAELGGMPLFEGGEEAAAALALEDGTRSIVVSINSHGTGTDGLQYRYARALIDSPPASGGRWEQLLARLHRYGQRAGQAVTFDCYCHTPEMRSAWRDALEDARYVQQTTGKAERLLFASTEGMDLD